MAGAIADVARQTLAADFRRIDPRSARIVLIEAGPRVLPTFPPRLSDYVIKTLERSNVEVRTGTLVTGCDERGVDLKNGRIDAETIIWAAGVMASRLRNGSLAKRIASGRVKVAKDLSVPDYPDIFVIGDTASVLDEQGDRCPASRPPPNRWANMSERLFPHASPDPSNRSRSGTVISESRDDWPPGCGREIGSAGTEGLRWLGVLERRAHLFFDRSALPLPGGVQLGVGLHHLSTRCALDNRGSLSLRPENQL